MTRTARLYIIKSAAALLLAILSAVYFFGVPRTSAWLRVEHVSRGGFKVGTIAFSFYGEGGTELPYRAYLTPTRYFMAGDRRPEGDSGRDALFNEAAAVHAVSVRNDGDIDIVLTLSYEDTAPDSHNLYYAFVPADPENPQYALFESGDVTGYLDGMLGAGASAADDQTRRAALDTLNQTALGRINRLGSGNALPAGGERVWCYIIAWTEYENVDWSGGFTIMSHMINLTAHADQKGQ